MAGFDQRIDPDLNDIDLRHLGNVVWSGKWIIGGTTLVAAIMSIAISLLLPNIYRANALLAPNDQDGPGDLSALASNFGGLAGLAGINLSGKSTSRANLAIEMLKSRKFIAEFIERHDILVPLIAANDWDHKTNKLEIDSDIYDQDTNEWVRKVSPPKRTVPSLQEATEVFQEKLSVTQDKKTGFITVSIEYYSPMLAAQWVNWLVEDLNDTVMRQDVTEAEQAIEYLEEQISNTSLTELRSIFFSLIEEQTKTVMLAEVSDEYLLKTIDPAIAPEEKSRPRRSLIVIFSTLLGMFAGLVIVFGRSGIRH